MIWRLCGLVLHTSVGYLKPWLGAGCWAFFLLSHQVFCVESAQMFLRQPGTSGGELCVITSAFPGHSHSRTEQVLDVPCLSRGSRQHKMEMYKTEKIRGKYADLDPHRPFCVASVPASCVTKEELESLRQKKRVRTRIFHPSRIWPSTHQNTY